MTATMAWRVPVEHPVFAGHFPGTPIVPGVLLLDTAMNAIAAQTGMILDQCEIRSVKFLSPARPGDELIIRFEIAASGMIRFEIVSGQRRLASGDIAPTTAASPESSA
jgi:3-hydroxymyristoyl/3-hydroxydecanoyl-(acyl carrier protein) dehydratase